RERIVLICSIQPEQLKVDDLKNEGPKLLKKYLQHARDVSSGKFVPTLQQDGHHNREWYLNEQIRRWGEEKFPGYSFEVNRLPMADLHIRDSKGYLGLVLTDDMQYYSSLSGKHFFAYTPSLMTKRNWDYQYLFSRNVWQDREKVEEEMLRFIGSRMSDNGV